MIKWIRAILGFKPRYYYQGRRVHIVGIGAIDSSKKGQDSKTIWEVKFKDHPEGETEFVHESILEIR
jgi:hypothetical protein